MDNKPRLSIETITPEVATKYLQQMKGNRPLSGTRVKRYSDLMKSGRWDYNNGDTISFCGENPIDGQHRLWACVKSGVPLTVIVVRGVSENAFSHKDIGKTRTGGDTLATQGIKNWNMVSSAARIVFTYENGIAFGDHPRIENDQTIDVCRKHPGIEYWCSLVLSHRKNLQIPLGPLSGFCYLFSKSDDEMAHRFLDHLSTGANLGENHPILALRNTVSKALRTPGSSPFLGYHGRQYMAGLLIGAWNAFKQGRELSFIRATTNAKQLKIK